MPTPPRLGVATRLNRDLEYGPNGGTFRRRRKVVEIDVTGVRWLPVTVIKGTEFKVADDLEGAGYRAFAPHGVHVIHRARVPGSTKLQRVERDVPIFGSYVFVGEPAGFRVARDCHPCILEVRACIGRVEGETPFLNRAMAEFVKTTLALWREGAWDERLPPKNRPDPLARFRVGGRVKIKSGPFANFEAVIARMESKYRVALEVNIFGRLTPVDVDEGHLQPIS